MHTTSVSLLERLRQPDAHDAWARFVQLYTPLLYGWAQRAGLQPTDAADLVQDVLAQLVQSLPSFTYDGSRSFRGWLRTVTLNKLREGLRRRRPLACLAPDVASQLPEPDPLPPLDESEHRQSLVREALRLVAPEFSNTTWKAFQQHVLAGGAATDVAHDLGIRIGTVYAAKSRVLAALRRELDGLWDG